MIWGFCVYFVYMIPLETDVLRKHRFQKQLYDLVFNHHQCHYTVNPEIFVRILFSRIVLKDTFVTLKIRH